MPEKTHVEGKKSAGIMLYALSTCGWCKKTKALLKELGVEYDYIDVDLLEHDEREELMKEISRWNPAHSFPTIVINDERSIVGFKPDELRKVVEE
jgi:glutaredoxin-like protein NrdH